MDRVVFKVHFTTSSPRKWWSQEEAVNADNEADLASEKRLRDEHRVVSRRIHILGAGSLGTFIAHALAGIPNRPPITLLLHQRKQLLLDSQRDWERQGTIEVKTDDLSDVRKDFDLERLMPLWKLAPQPPTDDDTIHNLIVAVKGPRVMPALLSVSHRLNRRSTIVFLQNGMGILDEVNQHLFKDAETRPNYVLGIVTHAVQAEGPFAIRHRVMGTTALAIVPRFPLERSSAGGGKRKEVWAPTSRYLLRTLTRTPVLAAVGFSPTDLTLLQLEKLVVSAVMDSLTVMFDCKNGALLFNVAVTRVMRLLLSEISLVIRSLPELQGVPNVNMRFSPERLESMIVSIAATTAGHLSTLLKEVRAGNETEIDYTNGYLIRRGEEIGIKCVMNYMLMQMVKGKRIIVKDELFGPLPMDRSMGQA